MKSSLSVQVAGSSCSPVTWRRRLGAIEPIGNDVVRRVAIILVALMAGVVAHEFTHSLETFAEGCGWHWPHWFTGETGPHGFPAIASTYACTTPHEAHAYGAQTAMTLLVAVLGWRL